MRINQTGVAHIVILLLFLVSAIGIGIYLVQKPAIFKPKASEVSEKGTIRYEPAGSCTVDDRGFCTVKVIWDTSNVIPTPKTVEIKIKENPGSLFASGPKGEQAVPWMTATGATFDLYIDEQLYDSIFIKGNTSQPTTDLSSRRVSPATPSEPNPSDAVANEVIVKYKDGQSPEELAPQSNQSAATESLSRISAVEQQVGITKRETLAKDTTIPELKNIEVIRARASVAELMEQYRNLPEVEYVQPNHIMKPAASPNDPQWYAQWNMRKIGMDQVYNPATWNKPRGTEDLLVAVVDTGIDPDNPDLRSKVIAGPNFGSEGNNVDTNGHGTNVASILAATVNNGEGVAGVSENVKILSIKITGPTGLTDDLKVANALNYAIESRNVRVINFSFAKPPPGNGSCGNSPIMDSIVEAATRRGILIVQGAGNWDADATVGLLSCSNVLAVGATTDADRRAPYSSYGSSVQISAPGGQNPPGSSCASLPQGCLVTWDLGQRIKFISGGTSLAAPHVSGAAALLLAKNPNLSVYELKYYLINSADYINQDSGKYIGPRLNVKAALDLLDRPACIESWACGNWGSCSSSGIQTRNCYDRNNCGTTASKPPTTQSCTPPPTCIENWSCDSWSECSSEGEQTRSCNDLNNCGTTTSKPPTTQSCTPPDPDPNRPPTVGACTPRPNILRTSAMTASGMVVNLMPGTNASTPSNPMYKIEFTGFNNGTVTVGSTVFTSSSSNKIYNVPAAQRNGPIQLTIKQVTYGQTTGISMKIHDTCSTPYPTFFGGGTGANWPH